MGYLCADSSRYIFIQPLMNYRLMMNSLENSEWRISNTYPIADLAIRSEHSGSAGNVVPRILIIFWEP